MMIPRLVFNFLIFFYLFFVGGELFAQELSSEQESLRQEIYLEVLSPFCPGRSLNDCPSSGASELKKEILDRVSRGESKTSIMEFLYGRYGESIRAVPKSQGFGVMIWVMPALFLGAGSILLLFWLRGKR